jgi:CheY-like chemotaxis protein
MPFPVWVHFLLNQYCQGCGRLLMKSTIPSLRILVVDDEPMVRDAIRILLMFDGHRVETVDGGEAALERLTQRQFDLVFTDLTMPGMSGEKLAAAIKAKLPQQVVVMVSSDGEVVDRHRKDQLSVDFVLTKPFDIRTLRDLVMRATKKTAT